MPLPIPRAASFYLVGLGKKRPDFLLILFDLPVQIRPVDFQFVQLSMQTFFIGYPLREFCDGGVLDRSAAENRIK